MEEMVKSIGSVIFCRLPGEMFFKKMCNFQLCKLKKKLYIFFTSIHSSHYLCIKVLRHYLKNSSIINK